MKLRALVLLGALLAGAGEARASTLPFDNYCRVGAIRTCASVHVVTTWDPVAQVTRVEIWISNLQGTLWAENTGGAPITRVGLTAPVINWPGNFSVTTSGGTVVAGNPGQYWSITNRPIEGPITFSTTTATAEGGVQGCNVFPTSVQSYYQTCGGGWVVFSFTTRNQWDAANAQVAWKVYTTAADGKQYYACRSADDPASAEFCEVVDPTVTPEPATVALLATGLAGLAGVARRRRRREEGSPETEDRA